MIPGIVSKMSDSVVASAASIDVRTDMVRVTGTTQINTINPQFESFGGFLVLLPVDGSVTLGTSGNILVGITALQNRAVFLVYSRNTAKWYINSGV